MDNLLLKFDQAVTDIFSKWDMTSTSLLIITITTFAYLVLTARDPDAHPMLLQRQSQASAVRQEGESAVYRSHSAPHGIPLNAGLGIKDPGDSKWSRGRDGDLRDIWRSVIAGVLDRDGGKTGQVGKILTVLGTERIIDHDLADLTRQINIIGQQLKQNGGKKVAIYLPNSVEFLVTLFACAFYGLAAVLMPFDEDQSVETIIDMLKRSEADAVIAPAGSFPIDSVMKKYPALKQLTWVVDEGSSHMDWNEVPKGIGGAVNVSTWQETIQDSEPNAGKELPAVERTSTLPPVLAFWSTGELMAYSQSNIVAGVAGQLTSIPSTQKITHSDLFLPLDALTTVYPLVLTLAALHSNSSVALTSVASRSPSLVLATRGIAPTIIVASAATLAKTHSETAAKLTSSVYDFVHWLQTRSLIQNGVMPAASFLSRMFDHLRPAIGTTPGKLRIIYVSKPAGVEGTPLSSQMLSDLRIYTSARIIYALTAAKVAGAVTQTGLYDYRVDDDSESHLGAPVTSLELLTRDKGEHKTTDAAPKGEIYVRGPAVVGGEATLGVVGKIRDDMTLALL